MRPPKAATARTSAPTSSEDGSLKQCAERMGIHRDVDETGGSSVITICGVAVDTEDERSRARRLLLPVGEGVQAIRIDVGALQVHGAASAEPRHHFPCGQHTRAPLP